MGLRETLAQSLQRFRIADAYEQSLIADPLGNGEDPVFADFVRVNENQIEPVRLDVGQERAQILNMCRDADIGRVVRPDPLRRGF